MQIHGYHIELTTTNYVAVTVTGTAVSIIKR